MTRHLLAFAGLAASAAFFVSAAHAAPELPGFYWPGGARQDSTFNAPGTSINGMRIDAFGALIDKINSDLAEAEILAQAAIPKAQIDVAGGVAGLDGNGRVTVPSETTNVTVGPSVSGAVLPQVYAYVNPQSNLANGAPFYWWDGNSSMRVGGTPIALPHNPYVSATGAPQAGTYQSLVLNGVPTGGYTAGCALCIFMEPTSILQAAVSAVSTVQQGTIPSADGVALFEKPVNSGFDLILPVATYTATGVTLSGTLTASELAHIQPMMTVFTNSQIPGVTPSGPEDADYYMGVIKSVATTNNVTTITVYGWGRQLRNSARDVPSTTSLETTFWSNRTTPVVGIGGFNKTFARNEYMIYDGTRGGGTGNAATSVVRSYTGDEMDMTISNETRANWVKYVGYVVNINMDPSHTNVLTHDSIGFYAGGNTPHHFMSGDSCYLDGSGFYDQSAFEGTATWIGGACQLGQLEAPLKRYDQEVAEFDGRSTGAPDFRLMYHISEVKQGAGTTATNILPHLGVVIGGAKGTGPDTGSVQADLQWDWNSNYGGLAICGNGTNCGFVVDGNGVAHALQKGLTTGNGFTVGAQPTGHVAALGLYADASYVNNLFEMMHGSNTAFALSTSGNAFFGGNVATGNGGQVIIPGVSGTGAGIGNYLSTDGYANLVVHAVNGGTSGLWTGRVVETAVWTKGNMPVVSHDGEHAWCSDCKLNGITGVEAYWHKSANKWTDSQNNDLTN